MDYDITMPIYTTSLVGRTRETAEILALLNESDTQLLTLTGVSGTGKTRLSIEVARALLDRKQAVVFVPLAAITKAELVLSEIARRLNIQEQSWQSPYEQIIEHLHEQQLVLILDNFEQIIAAATDIEQLIQALPKLKVLITSQITLKLTQEKEYNIPGLDIPEELPLTTESALKYAAIRLFVERIAAYRDEWTFTPAEIDSITQICQILEGLPLAIEIVAAHSDILSTADLQLLVRQHLNLYKYRAHKATGRERILLPMIEWSLSRLDPPTQEVFDHLGAFRGGWNRESLQAVMGKQIFDIQRALDNLVERHLVLEQKMPNGDIRYMMLDAIQAFADIRFKQFQFRYDALLRLVVHLSAIIKEYNQKLVVQETHITALDHLRAELPNIRAMLEWTIQHHTAAVGKLSMFLGRFWHLSGYWQEGVDWARRIIENTQPAEEEKAAIYSYWGMLLESLGSYKEATKVMHQGITIARNIKYELALATMLQSLGLIYLNQHKIDQARACFEECLAIGQRQNNKLMLTLQYNCLAEVSLAEQDYEQARNWAEQGLETAQSFNFGFGICATYLTLGEIALFCRDYQTSASHVDQALKLAIEYQLAEQRGISETMQSQLAFLTNQPDVAELLKKALKTLYELGANRYIIPAFLTSAAWFLSQNKLELVQPCLEISTTLRERLGLAKVHDHPIQAYLDTNLPESQQTTNSISASLSVEGTLELILENISPDS